MVAAREIGRRRGRSSRRGSSASSTAPSSGTRGTARTRHRPATSARSSAGRRSASRRVQVRVDGPRRRHAPQVCRRIVCIKSINEISGRQRGLCPSLPLDFAVRTCERARPMPPAVLYPRYDHPAIEERYASWQTADAAARRGIRRGLYYEPDEPRADAVEAIDEEHVLVVTDPLLLPSPRSRRAPAEPPSATRSPPCRWRTTSRHPRQQRGRRRPT